MFPNTSMASRYNRMSEAACSTSACALTRPDLVRVGCDIVGEKRGLRDQSFDLIRDVQVGRFAGLKGGQPVQAAVDLLKTGSALRQVHGDRQVVLHDGTHQLCLVFGRQDAVQAHPDDYHHGKRRAERHFERERPVRQAHPAEPAWDGGRGSRSLADAGRERNRDCHPPPSGLMRTVRSVSLPLPAEWAGRVMSALICDTRPLLLRTRAYDGRSLRKCLPRHV